MRASEEEEPRARRALLWIVDASGGHHVPYQMVGGAAAKAYGARRESVDIGIYVPFDEAAGLLEEARPYATWGPEHRSGEEWDLTFSKIDYAGQEVGLGGSSSGPRFFDRDVYVDRSGNDPLIVSSPTSGVTVVDHFLVGNTGTTPNVIENIQRIEHRRQHNECLD